ncbi:AMF1 Low affinity ammonium transporter [Candida maltosa Xu316]|uniref:Major facilitator superfamily (MFS) profile domain-containing protein n=1 Tax=Candida maltosa (strain Xu316) TaxID=1245528 RepID=M3JDV2_CANMX|nr:hypothetical protein G210_4579 [Candida maltosa Xu316]
MFDSRPSVFKSQLHEIILVSLICIAQLLTQAGITMSLSSMNIILQSFTNVDQYKKIWFMGSYALTVGTFILISGKLGDLFGLKLIFMIGWIWITIFSIITGFSYYVSSINFFIICRALQGIGFALLIPCGMGIVGNIYPNGKRKNFVFGCVGANGPIGAFVGALLSAVISQLWWWPWNFWILSIFTTGFGVMSYLFIPHIRNNNSQITSVYDALKKLDIWGCVTGVAGLILLNFVWNQGPVQGWNTVYIIVLLIIAVLLIVGLFCIELFISEYPLLPKPIFNIKIGMILACISCGWGSFGIWQYYYWNIILNLRKYTPIEGGLTYIPFFVMGVIASMLVSLIIASTKPSYIISFATVCFMVGDIMLAVTPIHQSFFRLTLGQMFILCWAMDMSFPAASIILSDILPNHNQGMAGSLVSTMINYSVSLFLGMSSTVEIEIVKKTGDELFGYRAGLYFGIGVAGLGVFCSLVFIFIQKDDGRGTVDLIEYQKEEVISMKPDKYPN